MSERDSLLPINVPTQHPRLRWFNTEDYWPVWIGFVWYFGVVLLTWCNLDAARITPWSGNDLAKSAAPMNIAGFLLIVAATLVTLYIAHKALGRTESLTQYTVICIIVIMCKIIGNELTLKHAGMGDSVWCIILGFLFGNIAYRFRPKFKPLLSLEFFIKVGIVLLAINLKEVAVSGAKGLAVAWAETATIIVLIYLIGTKVFHMNTDDSIVTSVGVSVCGSSAAMAVVDTIKAPKEMVMSLITVMSILTVPLIPALPVIAKSVGLNIDTAGAWIGGSVDSTGAVIATATLGGLDMLHAAVIIKMLQNILIGPVTLVITMIWHKTFRIKILWEKFPKFVLGFIAVGIVTTILPNNMEERVIDNSFIISEWFSSISFVLIGMDIDIFTVVGKVRTYKKIMMLYVVGQLIDLGTTLGVAYIMFTLV